MNLRLFHRALAVFLCLWLAQAPLLAHASLPSSSPVQSAQNYDPAQEAENDSPEDQPQVAGYSFYNPVLYKPEVVLNSYSVAEGSLVAGSNVTLRFEFVNTSRTKGIFDLMLTYKTSSNTLYSVYGESNSSFVTAIAPGGTYYVEKEFFLAKSAPEITTLEIQMRYQGVGTGANTGSTIIYLPVFGANSVNSQIDVRSTVYANTPVTISGYCSNAGSHPLVGLTMHIEGDIAEGPLESELGDIDKGGQISVRETVTFPETGTPKYLYISFSFSDTQGNQFSLPPREYTVNVLERPSEGDAQTPVANRTGMGYISDVIYQRTGIQIISYLPLIVIFLLLIVATAIYLLLKWRRNR